MSDARSIDDRQEKERLPYTKKVAGPEQWLFSALLDMVLVHCETTEADQLDSFGILANATAMRLLAEGCFIEIEQDAGQHVSARVLPAAGELTALIEAAERSRLAGTEAAPC